MTRTVGIRHHGRPVVDRDHSTDLRGVMSITPMETVSQDAAASGLVTVPAAGCRPARTAGTASRNSRRSTRKPIHP